MSTEFLYREKDGGACGLEIYSLHVLGSSGGGPWALRPKRLQWLNHTITTGFKIAAFPTGLRPNFFSRILIRAKVWREHSPPFSLCLAKAVFA